MDGKRAYSRGDRAALISFCSGRCYWPSCNEPVLKAVEGKYKILLEIAHIRALEHGGQRYDASMTDEQRNAFDNLIFLCRAHHQTVDERGAAAKYTVTVLQEWKTARETASQEQLRGLRNLTEDRLQTMINEAMAARDDDVKETLSRLERTDADAAALLRELRDELNEIRLNGPVLNADLVDMLSVAAYDLRNLEDKASLLRQAATGLQNLEDKAALLRDAAERLDAAARRAQEGQ